MFSCREVLSVIWPACDISILRLTLEDVAVAVGSCLTEDWVGLNQPAAMLVCHLALPSPSFTILCPNVSLSTQNQSDVEVEVDDF